MIDSGKDLFAPIKRIVTSIRQYPETVRQARAEGKSGWLRHDLEGLLSYFHTSTLVEGLRANGIRRILEVGTMSDFEALRQVLSLKYNGSQLFSSPDDVWAVDPQIEDDNELKYGLDANNIFGQFSVAREKVGDFKKRVGNGTSPFDLVFCRGTIGGESQKHVLQDMTACLNPQNPNALVMVSGIDTDRDLPYTKEELTSYGLNLVYSQPNLSYHAEYPYSLIICKKGNSPL